MNLIILRRAEKQIKLLPKTVQFAVGQGMRGVLVGVSDLEKKLQGYPNLYRIRVGKYRVVYEKKGDDIFVLLAEHRKDVYQSLKRIWG